MTFELLPVIEIMLGLYRMPLNTDRFRKYIFILTGGNKDTLDMPIGGFNPMAKEHILPKLAQLKELNTEEIIAATLSSLNNNMKSNTGNRRFKVALNLSDDLKGGWTNRFTADYDSKFNLNGLLNKNFCIPLFWASETYKTSLVKERTLEYCYRTCYRLANPQPKTLEEHILQEQFVFTSSEAAEESLPEINDIRALYQIHKYSTDFVVIFNFLYGDAASASLGNGLMGIKEEFAGLKFARQHLKLH
jgi:hypothetical protein